MVFAIPASVLATMERVARPGGEHLTWISSAQHEIRRSSALSVAEWAVASLRARVASLDHLDAFAWSATIRCEAGRSLGSGRRFSRRCLVRGARRHGDVTSEAFGEIGDNVGAILPFGRVGKGRRLTFELQGRKLSVGALRERT